MKPLALNEVHEGDCLELMPLIPDSRIDMVLADLPYGTTACKWDTVIPLEPLWEQYKRVIKSNGAIVLTASQPFTSALVMSNPKWFKYEWIWEKNRGTNFAAVKYQPMKEHENVLVFAQGSSAYFPIYEKRTESGVGRAGRKHNPSNTGKRQVYGGLSEITKLQPNPHRRVPRSVQKFNMEVGLHPTQKPVALFEYLIKTYTNEGETVLDNTAGSCTTAIAAIRTGRNFICIEKESEYVKLGRNRIKAELEQPRLLEAV